MEKHLYMSFQYCNEHKRVQNVCVCFVKTGTFCCLVDFVYVSDLYEVGRPLKVRGCATIHLFVLNNGF